MYKSKGFTVVEIVFVCVVISILVAITSIGWSAVMSDGRDQTNETEQKDWESRFNLFRQRFSVYPNATGPDNTTALTERYCLGSNFPSSQCGGGATVISATTSDNVKLLQDLAKVGTLPDYKHTRISGYIGPWVDYTNPAYIRIFHVFKNPDCPSGTIKDTTTTGANLCYIQLVKH